MDDQFESDNQKEREEKILVIESESLVIFTYMQTEFHIQPWWLGVFIRHVFHSVNSCVGHTVDRIPSKYGASIAQRQKYLVTIFIVTLNLCLIIP